MNKHLEYIAWGFICTFCVTMPFIILASMVSHALAAARPDIAGMIVGISMGLIYLFWYIGKRTWK